MSQQTKPTHWTDYLPGFMADLAYGVLMSFPFLLCILFDPRTVSLNSNSIWTLISAFIIWQVGYQSGWQRALRHQKPEEQTKSPHMASPIHLFWLLFILFMMFIGLPTLLSLFWLK
jgi:hypothetical protein